MKTQMMISALMSSVAFVVYADAAQETVSPATDIKPYYALVGNWQGSAQLVAGDQAPVKLIAQYSCQKTSEGMAVQCNFTAKGAENMVMSESDLFGVNPMTKQGHWYAVSNMGEVHDHLANWTDNNTMVADYEWKEDGKNMHEHIIFTFKSAKSMDFKTHITADKQRVAEFTGHFEL